MALVQEEKLMNAVQWSNRKASMASTKPYACLPFELRNVVTMRFDAASAARLGALYSSPEIKLAWVELHDQHFPVVIETGSEPPPPPVTTSSPTVAEALAAMQPASSFRRELHRALEESHRQQNAQRTLGTHAPVDWREAEQAQTFQSRTWSLALMALTLAFIWLLTGKRVR